MEIIAPKDMLQEHIDYYVEETLNRNQEKAIRKMILDYDGEDILVEFYTYDQPFERVRRITGYLVGTLDRFNNGKRAEEQDRVKHNF